MLKSNLKWSLSIIALFLIPAIPTVGMAFDHEHLNWGKVLKTAIVHPGPMSRVNYQKVKNNPSFLIQYLSDIEAVTLADYSSFSKNQKIAFLINAYNALTIKLVIDHYPVQSIRDIGKVLFVRTNPWKIEFFSLLGEKRNLDFIEHEMLRKEFSEPRIHFALVCASIGCPALRGEPYTPEQLDEQLEEVSRQFLRDEKKNRFDYRERTLYLSSIFKWYAQDFEKSFGSVVAYVGPRIAKNSQEKEAMKGTQLKVKYLDYDWSLNEAKAEDLGHWSQEKGETRLCLVLDRPRMSCSGL